MAITFTQAVQCSSTINAGSNASISFTLTQACASGATVLFWVVNNQTGANPTSVSGLGGTWSHTGPLSFSSRTFSLWVGVGCTGGTTFQINYGTQANSQQIDAMYAEFSGGSIEAGTLSMTSGTTDATPTTPSVTPGHSGDVVVGGFGQVTITSGTTYSVSDSPSAWTQAKRFYGGGITAAWLNAAYIAESGSAAQEAATASSGSASWVAWSVVLTTFVPPAPRNTIHVVNKAALIRAARF